MGWWLQRYRFKEILPKRCWWWVWSSQIWWKNKMSESTVAPICPYLGMFNPTILAFSIILVLLDPRRKRKVNNPCSRSWLPWVQTPQNPDISLNRSIEAFDQRATCAWVPLAFPLKLRYTCPWQKLQTWCHTRARARTFFFTKQWANTTLVAMFGIKEWSNYLGWWLLATTSSQNAS